MLADIQLLSDSSRYNEFWMISIILDWVE